MMNKDLKNSIFMLKWRGILKWSKSFFSLVEKDYITITEGTPRHTDYKVTPAFSPIPRAVLYLCTGQRKRD